MDQRLAEQEKEHFLRNIKQLNNNAILLRILSGGRMEPVFVSREFAEMMECSEEEAIKQMDARGFLKSVNPEDRPLVRSILKNRIAYDGGSSLTVQKITAKRNKIWCNVHFAFIDDYEEHYLYCTYANITTWKMHEERLRSTYAALGNNFYMVNDKTLSLFRVNLTRDRFEEIRGKDLFDTDSVSYTFSESVKERVRWFPIPSEQVLFLQNFTKDKLISGYVEGRNKVSQVLYSHRKDGRNCFVNISASITRHPRTGEIIAFITEL